MRLIHLIFATCILVTLNSFGNAKEWRGIIPLKSTRADVERLLGPSSGDPPRYYLPENTVYFQYANCRCGEKCKKDDWNVPPDTVILIRVGLKRVVKLADLKIDLADFAKLPGADDIPGSFVYKNGKEGFAIDGDGEYATALIYGPRAKDDYWRCKQSSSIVQPNRIWEVSRRNTSQDYRLFEIYSSSDATAVGKEKLDGLAMQMRAEPDADVSLLSYAGRQACVGEAKRRGDLVKKYLSRLGLNENRIVVRNAGFFEKWQVELWIVIHGKQGPPLRPTVELKDVEVIRPKVKAGVKNACSMTVP